MTTPTNKEVKAYITGKYDTDATTGCWIWNKAVCRQGYAFMNYQLPSKKWKKINAFHRYVYKAFNGPILKSTPVIRHTCNNPSCINPAHLIQGTIQDNVHDAIADKSHVSSRTKNNSSRLRFNVNQRDDIRSRILAGESLYSIAKFYNVDLTTIWGYKNRMALRETVILTAHVLSFEQREELKARLIEGKETSKHLAQFYGVSQPTIAQYKRRLKEQGLIKTKSDEKTPLSTDVQVTITESLQFTEI